MKFRLNPPKTIWLFDVSSGFEDVWERGGEQVDDGDEGGGVAIAAGACADSDRCRPR